MSEAAKQSGPARPRQKRALATRAALLAATERLVAAEGPAAVTTTRLAEETGVSVGTIYRYFEDREALLLAAYDATVERIVADCAAALETLPADLPAEDAARLLLGRYLEAAEAIPAHSGLLVAMRAIRPIAMDQGGGAADIPRDLLEPFLGKFAGAGAPDPVLLNFMTALVGTMVDLYLVTAEPRARMLLRAEIEAHVTLMVGRVGGRPATR